MTSESVEYHPILESERLYLREVRLSDVNDAYYRWMNDPAITRYLETRFRPQSMESIARYVQGMDGKTDEPFFAICLKTDHKHIGNIKLGPVIWIHRHADVSLLIGDKAEWGKGYATEAIGMVTRFAFEVLNLAKLKAGCYAPNQGSAQAFLKCGYQQEGLLREHMRVAGQGVDLLLLGITATDYFNLNCQLT